MQLETTRFGLLDFEESAIIAFTQPIIGFQEHRNYLLLEGPEGSGVRWLQSATDGELAFLLLDPRQVMPEYQADVPQAELKELGVEQVDALDVYTLLVVPQDPQQIRTNLKAPILINPEARLAKQTVLEKSAYPIQFYLAQAQPRGKAAQGGP